MRVLNDLLQSSDLDTFLTKHFSRLPLATAGGAKKYTDLLNWQVVKEVMDQKKSSLRIVNDGRMVKDYAEFNFEQAKEYYQKGNTLLLKNAELSHPALKDLSDDFARSFHTPVDIQLYCTPENHNAFGWHYDVEEVFIIQAKGSKLYSIRQNTIHPNPLVSSIPKDLGYENEKSELEIKVLLQEGDWLYIPSGWWHIAKTQAESMHISIGLMPRSAMDFVSFLPQYLSDSVFWRTRMPVHKKFTNQEEEVAFYQDAMTKLGKELQNKLADPKFITEFLAHLKK
ncbi:MAG: hypothetical protein H0V66_09055 [Bdellovibrionales bacterium]|nr:hypothetical protein [Bdellovibrionales bacterium]